jgi:hypothetical protein
MGTSFLPVIFRSQNKAASELRKQAGDMFRCKKVKGERPSPLLFQITALKRCYNLLFSVL